MTMLVVNRLAKTYGDPAAGGVEAIRDISFDVRPREFLCIVGPSGGGKTTLLRCLCGLHARSGGTIELNGRNITEPPPEMAAVFQDYSRSLMPWFTVHRNIELPLQNTIKDKQVRAERIAWSLHEVGLDGFGDRYPWQLSGGMQQRVGLARALAGDPEVLLFDEPFSALDPLIRRDMQNEVIRLHHEVGTTMVFVTHDLSEALKLGDRILIMRDGRLVQIGTGAELVGAPADDYVRDFVREVPRSHVLTLRWIMRPAHPDDQLDGPQFGPDVVVRDAVRAVLEAERPIKVVQDGRLLGVVGNAEILAVVAES